MISRRSLVALQHRNFRLIWIGLLLSMTGSMMQNAALLWQVSLLVPPDRKGLALGLVGLVRVVPIVVFSLISGVVADAWDRRKLMLFTQTGSALVALALAWLTFRGITVVWPIYALAALSSAVGAFDLPGAPGLVANPRSARASAQRDQSQHDDDADRIGGRPCARRPGDRRQQRWVGLCGQCGLFRVRDSGARRDAESARPRAVAGRGAGTMCRCTRRSKD